MISIDGLTVEFGGTTLFKDISFAINEKDTEEKELVIQELLLQQNNFTTINTEAFNAQSLKYLIYGWISGKILEFNRF